MGNKINLNIFPQFIHNLDTNSEKFHQQVKQKFIIKELFSNSPEHHHQIITNVHKFKQYCCPNIVRLLDSHTIQAHHLCSVITHMYVLFQKPTFTLKDYIKRQFELHEKIESKTLRNLLVNSLKGLHFCTSEGNDFQRIEIQNIYVDQDERGKITLKLFNPYFIQSFYDEDRHQKNAITDLGNILKQYIDKGNNDVQTIETILLMDEGKISLQSLQHIYQLNQKKKYRAKIKVTRNVTMQSRREQRFSNLSNGSSLLIDGGKDESQFMFKEFYQNFDHSISEISFKTQPFINENSIEIDASHQFPKKYINSRAFKKTSRSQKSIQTCQSDPRINKGQQLIKNASHNQHLFEQRGQILLSSAKMVQSFVQQL